MERGRAASANLLAADPFDVATTMRLSRRGVELGYRIATDWFTVKLITVPGLRTT